MDKVSLGVMCFILVQKFSYIYFIRNEKKIVNVILNYVVQIMNLVIKHYLFI